MRDESHFDVSDVTVAPTRARARWTRAFGAAASVAALALMVTWAYRLGVRDANDVPVVRAVDGPAKIRPEDPGGARFAHQGRAVYAGLRGEAEAVEDVALAPPPERLAEEDLAPAEVAAAAPEEPEPAAGGEAEALDFGAEVERLVAAAFAESAEPAPLDLVEVTARAPAQAPVAPARPGGATVAIAAADDAATAPTPASARPPAALDGPLIQLGAYFTEETALRMWGVIRNRNGDLLAGRDPVLEDVERAGRALVALRAGPFGSADEARALCDAMRSRDEDCIPLGAP